MNFSEFFSSVDSFSIGSGFLPTCMLLGVESPPVGVRECSGNLKGVLLFLGGSSLEPMRFCIRVLSYEKT